MSASYWGRATANVLSTQTRGRSPTHTGSSAPGIGVHAGGKTMLIATAQAHVANNGRTHRIFRRARAKSKAANATHHDARKIEDIGWGIT